MAFRTTDDLAQALTVEQRSPTTFHADVPDGWQQGRGAFGGLVLGLLVRAMEQVDPEPDRTLRTLTAELVAPVLPGAATLSVEVLRKGNGLTSLAARLTQAAGVLAHATANLAKGRPRDRDGVDLEPPRPPPWESVEVAPVGPPFGPEFAHAFEYRPTGFLPFSSGPRAGAEGWLRATVPLTRFGGPELVAHSDAWWPVVFARESAPRPMATVAFSWQACVDPATLDPALPLFHRARLLGAHDGYSMELRELWTPDGRLAALNPQTFALLR